MNPRKLFLSLTLSVSLVAFLSSYIPSATHSLEIGEQAPSLSFATDQDDSGDSLSDDHLLVIFWSAYDAESRLSCRRLADEVEKEGSKMRLNAVNVDSDVVLAREIADSDGIASRMRVVMSSEVSPSVLADYQVSKGCRSFLIDPYGRLEKIIR